MKTWEEICNDESGTIYKDWYEEGVRCLIMRGPASLCAYIGIPLSHPLANRDYDSIPLDVHGGLTFSQKGDKRWPEGFWWYGWDYAHAGDYVFYYDKEPLEKYDHSQEKKWLIDEVEKELSWVASYDFKKLANLTEDIAKKAKRNSPYPSILNKAGWGGLT